MLGGCALAPAGFTRSQFISTASTLSRGETVILGARQYGEVQLAPIHLDSDGRWSSGPPGPQRVGHTAAVLPDGEILVCGGLDPHSGMVKSAEASLYDPKARTWRSTTAMHTGRLGATAVTLSNGRVLVHGGTDNAHPASELYDPTTGTWEEAARFESCEFGQLVALRDGRALLVSETCAALYDPRMEGWINAAAPQHTHRGATLTALSDGRVAVVGGQDSGGVGAVTEFYEPSTDRWVRGPTPVHPRWAHSTTQVGDVLVIAGGRRLGPRGAGRRMHSVELFNLRSGERGRKSLGIRRSDHLAAGLANGDVVVLGGSVGMIFNNFPSHRYARIRLSPRWRRAARRLPR